MSFFDPVYPNDNIDERENDLLVKNESNETLDTDTITNNDEDQSSEV
jgi:hypothetical protein